MIKWMKNRWIDLHWIWTAICRDPNIKETWACGDELIWPGSSRNHLASTITPLTLHYGLNNPSEHHNNFRTTWQPLTKALCHGAFLQKIKNKTHLWTHYISITVALCFIFYKPLPDLLFYYYFTQTLLLNFTNNYKDTKQVTHWINITFWSVKTETLFLVKMYSCNLCFIFNFKKSLFLNVCNICVLEHLTPLHLVPNNAP